MPDIMTESELAELRALEAAATPGPWTDDARGHWGDMPRIYGDGFLIAVVGNAQPERGDRWDDDARFIRASRNAVPRLLATVEALREAARGQIVVVATARQMQMQAERERDEALTENERLREVACGKDVIIEMVTQGQKQAERKYDIARMALETRPCAADVAAANYRAKTAERERDEAHAENERLRAALEPFAELSDAVTNSCCKLGNIDDCLMQDDFRRARAALKGGNADA